ncbi:MAG TPA: C39 family peptidase [Burkholderiales bacterium]|nr:C39 family peptidase [Burkholderiales bacterium]
MKKKSRGVRGRFALATLAGVLFASQAVGQPVRSLIEMRHEGVVIQQWDISCGAAALATVFTYELKVPVTERQVAQDMLRRTDPLRVKVRGGFSLLDMKRYADLWTYPAEGYRGLSLEELVTMPSPIVPIEEYGNPHFVVVRGLRDGKVDIADPAFGNRMLSVDHFKELWQTGLAFVVRRP